MYQLSDEDALILNKEILKTVTFEIQSLIEVMGIRNENLQVSSGTVNHYIDCIVNNIEHIMYSHYLKEVDEENV